MKPNLSLAAILSTVAISGGILLTTTSPSEACAFSKANGIKEVNSANSPSLDAKKLDFGKLAIAGGGIAALGGLFAAGMSYKARLAAKDGAVAAEVPIEHPEVPADATSVELLYPPNTEEVATSSTADKELTRVG